MKYRLDYPKGTFLLLLTIAVVVLARFNSASDYLLIKLALAQLLMGLLFFRTPLKHSGLVALMLAYALLCLLSYAGAEYKYPAGRQLVFILTCAAAYLAASSTAAERNARLLAGGLILSASLASAAGIIQHHGHHLLTSTLGNQNVVAGFLVPCLLAAGCLLAARGIPPWERALYAAACAVMAAAVWFCDSRAAFLGLAGGLFMLMLTAAPRRGTLRWILLSLPVAAFAVVLLVYRGPVFAAADDVRPLLWKGTLGMIADRPVLGHGIGSFPAVYPVYRLPEYFIHSQWRDVTVHAHCEYLQVWAETGIIGLALFCGIAALFLHRTARFCRGLPAGHAAGIVLGARCAAFAMLIHAGFDVTMSAFSNSFLYFCLLGIAEGLMTPAGTPHPARTSPLARVAGAALMIFAVSTANYELKSSICHKAGRKARERGDWSTAIKFYQKAAGSNEFDTSIRYSGLAYAYAKSGMIEDSIREYKEVLKLSPYYARTHANLGALYLEKREFRKALIHLRLANHLNPYDKDIKRNLAAAKNKKGDRLLFPGIVPEK